MKPNRNIKTIPHLVDVHLKDSSLLFSLYSCDIIRNIPSKNFVCALSNPGNSGGIKLIVGHKFLMKIVEMLLSGKIYGVFLEENLWASQGSSCTLSTPCFPLLFERTWMTNGQVVAPCKILALNAKSVFCKNCKISGRT